MEANLSSPSFSLRSIYITTNFFQYFWPNNFTTRFLLICSTSVIVATVIWYIKKRPKSSIAETNENDNNHEITTTMNEQQLTTMAITNINDSEDDFEHVDCNNGALSIADPSASNFSLNPFKIVKNVLQNSSKKRSDKQLDRIRKQNQQMKDEYEKCRQELDEIFNRGHQESRQILKSVANGFRERNPHLLQPNCNNCEQNTEIELAFDASETMFIDSDKKNH
ncbi:uncharacterized protein LOC124499855 [Dermatophagoides farinae]|uniref:uncharacterized protein LOC124499855 n=1 Tax=Dermatophagoides farinae TaxID=6954 RepID=UPI003F61B5D2